MYFYFLHFDLFIIIIINSIINKILREKMIEIKVFDLIFRNFSYKYIYSVWNGFYSIIEEEWFAINDGLLILKQCS